MLQFESIQKYYNSFLALEIPSLSVNEGTWWVKGENGSGKTTFLKMVAGFHPFKGNIILNNKISLKKHRQQYVRVINYAEAEPLYPLFITGRDLTELFCYTKGGDISKTKELLKRLHVYDAYNQPLGSYSSGMIKKVSLALAFTGEPKLILLDEPLITIDAKAIETICDIITNKQKEGISFIITSHQSIYSNQLSFTGTLMAENKTIINLSE